MKKKIVSQIMLTLLITSMLTLAFNIQSARAVGEVAEFDEITATVEVEKTNEITDLANNNGIFYPRVTYETGPWAYAVAVGDLNSDGLNDVVVTNIEMNNIDVFIQNSLGTLDSRVSYTISSISIGVAVGDVNGDDLDDVVAANLDAESISVLTQNPLGTLNPRVTYTVGERPISVKIGDLNSDGLNDVVVTNWSSDTISVLTQNPSGLLNPQVTYATGSRPWGLSVGDVNSDGKVDVVAGNCFSDTISVYTQTVSGTLSSQVTYGGCDSPRGIDIGDVNGDGKNDVVVGNGEAGTIGIFSQNTDGGLNPMVSYTLTITGKPEGPSYLVLGDLNSDGLNDILVSIANVFVSPYTINIFIQGPMGELNPPFSLHAGHVGDSRGVAICDLNGDQRNDFVVADGYYENTISVYIQRILLIPAVIDIFPDTLHLMSKGQWITCYIELPEGYNVSDIDVSTIMLEDTIPVSLLDVPAPHPVPVEIGDYDNDTIPDLMVKFDRAMVSELILSRRITDDYVTLTITGKVDGVPFAGEDTIRVLMTGGGTKGHK